MSESRKCRFCVQTHLFNVDRFILPMLENCGPHVERIYVARSERPWRYNERYKDLVINPTPLSILDKSPWRDKITILEGEWANDEDQRNDLLEMARKDGMDYMIVQDADEYLLHHEYEDALRTVEADPDFDAYMVDCLIFWKTTEYLMQNRFGGVLDIDKKLFVLNCRTDVEFHKMRSVDKTACRIRSVLLPAYMYHLSYVMDDAELHKKFSVWGHTNDFDWVTWYNRKWLKWHLSCRLLGLRKARTWARAQRFTGVLPEVLKNFDNPKATVYTPKFGEWLTNQIAGLAILAYYRTLRLPAHRLRLALGLDKEEFFQTLPPPC